METLDRHGLIQLTKSTLLQSDQKNHHKQFVSLRYDVIAKLVVAV